jgi:oxalate decarboxylase family bicupin protein
MGSTNPAREAQNPSRLAPPQTDHGTLPSLKWSFADSHNRLRPGGWARQTTIRELPIATELAGVNMRLKAGAVRERHWHKEAEWAFTLKGRARITSVDQNLCTFQDDVGEGEEWNFPAGIPHSIQGLEDSRRFAALAVRDVCVNIQPNMANIEPGPFNSGLGHYTGCFRLRGSCRLGIHKIRLMHGSF